LDDFRGLENSVEGDIMPLPGLFPTFMNGPQIGTGTQVVSELQIEIDQFPIEVEVKDDIITVEVIEDEITIEIPEIEIETGDDDGVTVDVCE